MNKSKMKMERSIRLLKTLRVRSNVFRGTFRLELSEVYSLSQGIRCQNREDLRESIWGRDMVCQSSPNINIPNCTYRLIQNY